RDTHRETRQVVVRILVEAGELRRLAAHQRHAVGEAGASHPGYQGCRLRSVQAPDAEVVQEEQWIGTLHGDVVDAVVYEVLAHRVVPIKRDRDLELGADPMGGSDQHRVWPSVLVEPKQAAEAADSAEDL